MTKIRFQLAPKPTKAEKIAQGKTGFVPVAKRWIVERSNAWMERCKSLVKNFERTLSHATAKLNLCFIRLMLKLLASSQIPNGFYRINTSNIGNKSSLKGKVRRITDQESQPESEDIVNESLAKMQEVPAPVESVTQTAPAIIADDVTIGLISNVEILSNEQLMLVLKTVETELSKRNPRLN